MNEAETNNPWTTLNTKSAYQNPWIEIEHHDVLTPAGNPGIYGVVKFKNLAIGIIPLDKDNYTWIVGQYRYPHKKYSWEIPEGGGPIGIDPLDSAKRELLEECGIIATNWELILEMDLSNSATDERALLYVARDLSFTHSEPEETEDLQVKKIPFSELFERVMDGSITDAMTVGAVLKLQHLLNRK
ncbi:MAG: DNA mismatch repair protein MutT [Bacteroidetes bacterium B1(2017)]|nr:MAG: DNA mismatch repair protein MutT [Bacteroidetes bacterium B1(2017)]